MGTIYENIIALCEEHNVKPSRMCLDIGTSKSLISELKHGRAKSITAPTAQKIADYFGVSVDRVLTGEEPNKKTPTENDERLNEFYELFKELPDELQARELAYLKELLSELNK